MTIRVYALVDPRTGDVRYVGQTIKDLSARLRLHRSIPVNTGMAAWLAEMDAAGLEPEMRAVGSHESQADADSHEASLVASHAQTGRLLNRTKDGRAGRPRGAPTVILSTRVNDEAFARVMDYCESQRPPITISDLIRERLADLLG